MLHLQVRDNDRYIRHLQIVITPGLIIQHTRHPSHLRAFRILKTLTPEGQSS